jgi:hypothetical protein
VFGTPAIGDFNGDGRPDVVYGSYNEYIYAKDGRTGRDLAGWPKHREDTIWSSPALADINGDGSREIVIGTDTGGGVPGYCPKSSRGTMSIHFANGAYAPNFPKCVDTPIWSSPAVQDVNGDGHVDVIAGTNNYQENGTHVGTSNVARAWDSRTGKLLWQTSLGGSGQRVFASPAVGDVGADGTIDVAIGTLTSGADGSMFLLNARTGAVEWQNQNASSFGPGGFMGSPVIADITGDGRPEVIAATQNGTVVGWNRAGSAVKGPLRPDDRDGSRTWIFNNSPAIGDLDGDGKSEIVAAGGVSGQTPRKGFVWVLSSSGNGSAPWPFFKKTTDRVSAFGAGSRAPVPNAPPPTSAPTGGGGTRTTAAPKPATSTSATPSPTASTALSPVPSASSFALTPTTPRRSNGARLALAIAALGLVAGGIALGVVAYRRWQT